MMTSLQPFPHHERVLWIPGRVPSLNEITDMHWSQYNRRKRSFGQKLTLWARSKGFPPFSGGHFSYRFIETDRRRDPSNFIAGGLKFIEDALQEAGLLKGDGWDNVWSITVSWELGEKPGVEVHVLGMEWEESEHEREQKGQNKFRRRTAGRKGLPKLAGAPAGRKKPAARAAVPARKHRG